MQIYISPKKQLYTILLLLVLALIYYLYSPANFNKLLEDLPLSANKNKEITGFAKVVDGDSIIITNHEIRILHIDAPEYHQTCQDANQEEYDCGKIAIEFLKSALKKHQTTCNIIGQDVYKRYLANCRNNNRDISQLMIRSGWALIYKQPSLYFSDQEYARLNKLGIWQGNFLIPKTYRKLNPRE